ELAEPDELLERGAGFFERVELLEKLGGHRVADVRRRLFGDVHAAFAIQAHDLENGTRAAVEQVFIGFDGCRAGLDTGVILAGFAGEYGVHGGLVESSVVRIWWERVRYPVSVRCHA